MKYTPFSDSQASHEHSLETLNLLAEYDSFMESVDTLADFGCGADGLDLEWWATRHTRDDGADRTPLNIKCTGVDLALSHPMVKKYTNVSYRRHDLEREPHRPDEFDVVWCHDSFQYMLNPIGTLRHWNAAMRVNGMLCIIVPQTTNLDFTRQAFDQWDGQYFNHTMVSLIHMLAVNGFDCKSGFFKKAIGDPWLHAVVYKSEIAPLDPRTTSWFDLAERRLLPESTVESLTKYGCVRQHDLVLPWLDKNLSWLGYE